MFDNYDPYDEIERCKRTIQKLCEANDAVINATNNQADSISLIERRLRRLERHTFDSSEGDAIRSQERKIRELEDRIQELENNTCN